MRSRIGNRNPVLFDRAIGADQRRRANRPIDGFTLGILTRPPGTVGFHDLDLWVRQQSEG